MGFHHDWVVLSDLTTAIGKVANLMGRVVRFMPNPPVKVRKGSVAVTFSQGCSALDRERVTTIFSRVGRLVGGTIWSTRTCRTMSRRRMWATPCEVKMKIDLQII